MSSEWHSFSVLKAFVLPVVVHLLLHGLPVHVGLGMIRNVSKTLIVVEGAYQKEKEPSDHHMVREMERLTLAQVCSTASSEW
jgi:hypothetical protein